jgi:putative effector of murein hydrolase LrgA (UPF0299 family)
LTSPISDFLGWAMIGYVTIIGVGRLLFTRDAIFDQLINRTLLWGLAGLVFYRCTPTLSVGSVTNLLALGCSSMVIMHLYGLARLWESGADAAATWQRQRIYSAVAAVSTVLTLLAGPSAGSAGRLVEQNLNWAGLVVWIAHGAPLVATTLVYTRLCIRELRLEDPRPAAKALFSLMLLSFVPIYADLVLLVGEMGFGWELGYPHIVRSEIAFTFATVLATTLVAGPMVGHLLEHAGLDRDGRICRRLRPLWRDVTAAVPEIVMFPAVDGVTRPDTTARLLRMTVEIRDAILHLGPYLPMHTATSRAQHDGFDRELRVYACQLAGAVRARKAGVPPTTSTLARQAVLTARDFDTELRQLLDLARVWPTARAATRAEPFPAHGDAGCATI